MPHKLLLADDSVTIQRVIELTFADEDVQVIAVGDGRQAIERIETEMPDIVLADVGMPERNGYDVAAFVKNTPEFAHIPVLLLTGAFEPVDEQRARAAGCDGVLAKPFEPHMVIARVKELLAASAGGGTAAVVDGPTPVSVDVIGIDLVPPPPMAEDTDPGAGEAAGESPAALAGAAPEPFAPPGAQPPERLSRRMPIAVPGFGAPVPATGSTAAKPSSASKPRCRTSCWPTWGCRSVTGTTWRRS